MSSASIESPQISPRQPIAEQDNPYLAGNFAPVDHELDASDLPVTGTIPEELDGHLLRNGPNPIEPGPDYHWFVGDGMLHAIEFGEGRALSYRNRWIRTPQVEALKGFPAAPVSRHELIIQGSGSVNIIENGGHLLGLPEIGLPYEVNRKLETVRMYDFDEKLASNMTAHPKIDGRTGELVFFGYDFGEVHLRYHTASQKGDLERTVEIATPISTMMHDFGVTETRVVFMDFPVVFDANLIEQGARIPYAWSEEHPARLGILPRDATHDVTQWIEIDPCFVYHPLNAYDDGEKIIMHVVQHEKTFVGSTLDLSLFFAPRLVRWTIDPTAGRVDEEIIYDGGLEFPRLNPRFECHPNRYGYAAKVDVDGPSDFGFSDLLKIDLDTREILVHEVGEGRHAAEGVFVPSQRSDAEDDGYLLSVVYDENTNRSDVVIVDCLDFTAPPLATVHLPVRVPFGFHGNFMPRRS